MTTIFKATLISVFCSLFLLSNAQLNPPELRCISIESNGDITLDWMPTSNIGAQFKEYVIYGSVNGSPYVGIANLTNILQNTYTQVGANWGNPARDYKFYIRTKYDDGSGIKESASSDTIRPIVANLTVNINVSGIVRWNNIVSPALPTSGPKYKLNRRFSGNPPKWQNGFAELPLGTEVFRDTVARCDDSIFYQIELPDQSGCVSKSNVAVARLKSGAGPAPWPLTKVTVNRTHGATELFWNPHPNKAVIRYIIIYDDPSGSSKFIDTVSAANITYKNFDNNYSAHQHSRCYRIAAVDSCWNTQGGGPIIHCTMHLAKPIFDPCKGQALVAWTPYKGWSGGVKEYNIYMALDSDTNYTKLGTVSGNDTSFSVGNITSIPVYKFYIEAVDASGGILSYSNLLGTKFPQKDKTNRLILRSASYVNESTVQLKLYVDRKAPISKIDYFRAIDDDGPFKKVGSYVPQIGNDSILEIRDSLARPSQLNYTYYLVVKDECDQPIVVSERVRTMLLTGKSVKYDLENTLSWTRNIARDTTTKEGERYIIYKSVNGEFLDEPIRNVDHTTKEYVDDFSDDIYESADFCYYIKLTQEAGILKKGDTSNYVYPISDTSYSNTVCFEFEPDVFVANSFTPNNDGNNEIWKPKVTFVVPFENYLLEVFNRWGKLVFETTDPSLGWDGRFEGYPSPVGQYLYHYRVTTVHGSTIEDRGYFQLVR